VNTNSGTLIEINQTTMAQTVLAIGGSRGDFVTVDPTNDTLLITQTDRIIRLSGATFTPSAACTGTQPEASSEYSQRRIGSCRCVPPVRPQRYPAPRPSKAGYRHHR